MASPVHAVHTIHGTLAGIQTRPLAFPAHSTCTGLAMDLPAPGLAKAAWRVVPISIPPSCRRLSPNINVNVNVRRPAPQRATTAQPVHFPHQDPFDDRHASEAPAVQTKQVMPYQRTRLASQSFAVKVPRASHMEALVRQRTAQRLAQDREARCKAVAGILLNRVYAVGKPMRRASPPNPDVPRTYKRSRLSTMTTVDDL